MINSQPTNKNFLSQVGFRFNIKKLPTTSFFVQSVNLPGIEMKSTNIPTPFINIPVPGDHVKYSDLTVTFKIDEDMKNYIEIHDWIIGLGFPNNYEEYKNLKNKGVTSGDGLKSDAALIILTSSRNPSIEIDFIDIFPTSLTDVIFDSRDTNIDYVQATATFKFRKYTIKQL